MVRCSQSQTSNGDDARSKVGSIVEVMQEISETMQGSGQARSSLLDKLAVLLLQLTTVAQVTNVAEERVLNEAAPNLCALCRLATCDSLLELRNKLEMIFQNIHRVAGLPGPPEANANANGANETAARVEDAGTKPTEGIEEKEKIKTSIFCYCGLEFGGEMIRCDNRLCELKWFHTKCVPLKKVPNGKWYCPECKSKSYDKSYSRKLSYKRRSI